VSDEGSPAAPPTPASSAPARRDVWGLGLLFGAIYFIQGIAEPTEGLISQPVKSWLSGWGHKATTIGVFGFIMSLPWAIKPVFGLLSDFVPLAGSRRRSYFILASAMTAAGLGFVYLHPPQSQALHSFLGVMLIATFGVAFSDVLADALMVEKGQPRGITGVLQSVQWTAMYVAAMLAGEVGGYLSQHNRREVAFLICGVFMAANLVVAFLFVRDEPRTDAHGPPLTFSLLWRSATTPVMLAVAAFLALWSFNPFSNNVLYVFMREELTFSERFCGRTATLLAVGSVLGSVTYGLYCRRVPFTWLLHLSIVMGILNTIAYWWMAGEVSAIVVTLTVGFTYMTGNLIQLDLAARVCPPVVAGTLFASLMAVSNLSLSLATMAGGHWYDTWRPQWGGRVAFNILVGIGAAFTAACWLLVPVLKRWGAGEPPSAELVNSPPAGGAMLSRAVETNNPYQSPTSDSLEPHRET
jgi:MFS family permease